MPSSWSTSSVLLTAAFWTLLMVTLCWNACSYLPPKYILLWLVLRQLGSPRCFGPAHIILQGCIFMTFFGCNSLFFYSAYLPHFPRRGKNHCHKGTLNVLGVDHWRFNSLITASLAGSINSKITWPFGNLGCLNYFMLSSGGDVTDTTVKGLLFIYIYIYYGNDQTHIENLPIIELLIDLRVRVTFLALP